METGWIKSAESLVKKTKINLKNYVSRDMLLEIVLGKGIIGVHLSFHSYLGSA